MIKQCMQILAAFGHGDVKIKYANSHKRIFKSSGLNNAQIVYHPHTLLDTCRLLFLASLRSGLLSQDMQVCLKADHPMQALLASRQNGSMGLHRRFGNSFWSKIVSYPRHWIYLSCLVKPCNIRRNTPTKVDIPSTEDKVECNDAIF